MNKNLVWREKRQECFDIHQHELKPFLFDEDRLVYGNVNLSIFLTEKCNAKCKFCVAELRYVNTGATFVKPTIQDDEEYYDRLEEVLIRVKPINPSVSITGGEPTHSHRIKRVCELLKKHNIRKRTITTNGTGLLNKVNGTNTVLDVLIENEFKHLNISRAHYDSDDNRRIMGYTPSDLTCNDLYWICKQSSSNGLRPRLSCVLLHSGIKTMNDIKEYMKFALFFNIDNVVFRELMNYDSKNIIKGKMFDYCERNRISLNKVWKMFDQHKDFELINQVLGYYYYVEVYKYRNLIDMVTESANLKQIPVQKSKPSEKPIVYEMVFHPNGCLNGSWREWEDILLSYERK